LRKQHVKAVDDVSLEIMPGETLALVGESGSGKTTVSRAVLGLVEPTGGRVYFRGRDITRLDRRERRQLRREVQAVFQNPYTSLNPRRRVIDIVAEPLRVHRVLPESSVESRVTELLEAVGLDGSHRSRFPHEFSGGQRQRIAIARALALNPSVIVCDEPVSGLDVSVQANIINLLKGLQEETGISLLFVSHDLGVVRSIAHRVAVMYLGRIVEQSMADDLYEAPKHPYTSALLASVLSPLPSIERARTDVRLRGSIPNPAAPPPGCHLSPRCPHRQDICSEVVPPLLEVGLGHVTACHLYGALAGQNSLD
jgi:oligopeptide/dipeptide ABC transporter ATP-binding protein